MTREHSTSQQTKRTLGTRFFAALYVVAIVSANLLAGLGTLPVGGGLRAPLGVLPFGITFGLRDSLHERLGGSRAFWLAVLAALLSFAFGWNVGRIALAGLVTDLVSEAVVDTGIYALLHARWGTDAARWSSNLVSLTVDSVLFILLSGLPALFGVPAWVLIAGQILGKLEVSALAEVVRRVWLSVTPAPEKERAGDLALGRHSA